MTINTRSVFFYGFSVDQFNQSVNFSEGGSEITALLDVGDYTLESGAIELARAMTEVGGQAYSVIVDRSTRKLTISATGNFELLVSTGSNVGADVYSLVGFNTTDRTGSNSYEGDLGAIYEYRPQFYLQSYVSAQDNQGAVSSSVSNSGSGIPQVVTFGDEYIMECNITLITDINQGNGNPIETNLSGVADLRTFMQNIVKKTKLEFMEDRDTPNTYESFILESTPASSVGVGFKLNELYGRNLANYYETGVLNFRRVTP